MRGRTGNAQSQLPQQLPQEEIGKKAQLVRVSDAFFQFLPSQQLTFFQRPYFARYPIPLVIVGSPPYPRPVPLCRIKAPAQQGVVVQHTAFKVYEHTGIDPEDVVEVDPTRLVTVFGFQFAIGNRGTTDLNTNVTARGDIINYGGDIPIGFAPTPGQGSFYPFGGAQQKSLNNWAAYARPNQTIEATVVVLRPPPFDVRLFSFELGGFLLPEFALDTMLERRKG
jgi:hypothetical protein